MRTGTIGAVTTTQAVLAGLCSLGFVVLGAIAVRAALRARRLPAPARWAVAAVLLVLVLVSWGSTLAPRTDPDAGTVCIEEPLLGLAADSDLATDGCLSVNREAVADRLLGAAALALVAVVGGRVLARRAAADAG